MTDEQRKREAIEAVLTELHGSPVRTWTGLHAALANEVIRLRSEVQRLWEATPEGMLQYIERRADELASGDGPRNALPR